MSAKYLLDLQKENLKKKKVVKRSLVIVQTTRNFARLVNAV